MRARAFASRAGPPRGESRRLDPRPSRGGDLAAHQFGPVDAASEGDVEEVDDHGHPSQPVPRTVSAHLRWKVDLRELSARPALASQMAITSRSPGV